jgi:Skp family chaperone for outer membrane proteins
MNLVGKIFIVLILITSVFFMAIAMAVYATHKNWRDVVVAPDVGLQARLDKAKAENKALTDEAENLKKQFDAEKAAKTQALAKLESELEVARGELKALDAKQAELEKAKREAVAAMNATQENATGYRKEVEGQRTAIEDARKDRDLHFKEVVKLTDELNQAANEKDLLRKRTEELAKDVAKADQVLRKFGFDKNKDYSDRPPTVDGIITHVTQGVVEISIGSDEGLMKGHKLEVYRIGGGQNAYVGRIEVVRTEPSRAVCRIDPKFQNSNMMVGDRVASKIE